MTFRFYGRLLAAAVVVALVLGRLLAPDAAQAAQEVYNGANPTSQQSAYLVHDWDVSRFTDGEARFTVTLTPGSRFYARWECNDYARSAIGFSWAASQTSDYTVAMSKQNAPNLYTIFPVSSTLCAFHIFPDAANTGRFSITGSIFVMTLDSGGGGPAPSAGSFGATLPPASESAGPSPEWTYCPQALPTGFYGPPAPSLCPVPTPTPAPTAPADANQCIIEYASTGNIATVYYPNVVGTLVWSGGSCNKVNAGDVWHASLTSHVGDNADWDRVHANPPACNTPHSYATYDLVSAPDERDISFVIGASSCEAYGLGPGSWGLNAYQDTTRPFRVVLTRTTAGPSSDPLATAAPTATPGPTSTPPTITPPPAGGGGAGTSPGPINICPGPRPSPDIAACVKVTPAPTLGTAPPGQGDPFPLGSPIPNGLEPCAVDSTFKPGMMPYESIPTNEFPGLTVDVGRYVAWVGGAVNNVGGTVRNTAVWGNNAAVDAVVPGECVGNLAASFVTQLQDTVPFAWVVDVQTALADTGGGSTVSIPTMTIAGQSISLGSMLSEVATATSPYRGILAAFFWLLAAMAIFRAVRGTVGVGEGGG